MELHGFKIDHDRPIEDVEEGKTEVTLRFEGIAPSGSPDNGCPVEGELRVRIPNRQALSQARRDSDAVRAAYRLIEQTFVRVSVAAGRAFPDSA